MKTSLTSFDICALSTELQCLIGGWIGKIYQPSRNEFLMRVRADNEKLDFYVNNGNWLTFIPTKKSLGHDEPSTFAMTCRKYLNRGKICNIKQMGFERIIIMDIQKDILYHLVFELFSKGNIILLGENNTIILPLYTQTWSHRVIKPHELYSPPPLRTDPFTLDFSAFSDLLMKQENDLIHALVGPINLGGQWGEEICRRAHLAKTVSVQELTDTQLHTLFSTLQDVLNTFSQGDFFPVIVKDEDKKIDVLPLPLTLYDSSQLEKKETFAKAVTEYFHQDATPEEPEEFLALQRIKEQQEKAVTNLRDVIGSLKREGDLIYVHYGACQQALDSCKKEYVKKGASSPICVSVKDTLGKDVEIGLDARKDINENASEKYGKAKKMQAKLEGALKALELTQQQLRDYKKNQRSESKRGVQQVKKLWFEQYRWFISSEGNIVIGGKNASSNDKIVKKYLAKGDRYIHANMKGAPSCVVKAQDIQGNPLPISETTLQEACQFAVVYSKAWNRYGEMDAYWVKPEQVSKSPPPGEYLPRGSFIITGKRHYHRCPLEYGLGVIAINDISRVMGAPSSVVRKLKKYLLFVPGKQDKNTVANGIASRLHVPSEAVQSVLPPGDIDILEDHL